MIAILVFVIILIIGGLASTVKYAYFDEMEHYHTDVCYVIDCTDVTYPDNVINVTITFYLSLTNETEYTKTDWTTKSGWSHYCSNSSKEIRCYYDDRHIFDSLRLFKQYTPDNAVTAIFLLSMGLFVVLIITIAVGCRLSLCLEPEEIDFEDPNTLLFRE